MKSICVCLSTRIYVSPSTYVCVCVCMCVCVCLYVCACVKGPLEESSRFTTHYPRQWVCYCLPFHLPLISCHVTLSACSAGVMGCVMRSDDFCPSRSFVTPAEGVCVCQDVCVCMCACDGCVCVRLLGVCVCACDGCVSMCLSSYVCLCVCLCP